MNYICILRGINVSGHNVLKMDNLKVSLSELKLENIVTYIQSGNVVFSSVEPAANLESLIQQKILKDFGYEVPVQVKSLETVEKAFKEHPFSLMTEDLSLLHITFLGHTPDQKRIQNLQEMKFTDQFEIRNDAVYLYCPNGYGRTKLNNTFLEKLLAVQATTRNMKTVKKLIELGRL